MDTAHTSTTLVDELTRPASRNRWRRTGRTPAVAIRRPRAGRQVLQPKRNRRPNSRLKAARHPWADRLDAARHAGFVVEERGDVVLASCYACGEQFGIAGQSTTDEDREAEELFRAKCYIHDNRICITGLVG
jgi:hypothetical protein